MNKEAAMKRVGELLEFVGISDDLVTNCALRATANLRRPGVVVPGGLAMSERVGDHVGAINRNQENLFRVFNAADADGFVAPIADDVVWMSHSGAPPTVGKEAVRSGLLTRNFSNGDLSSRTSGVRAMKLSCPETGRSIGELGPSQGRTSEAFVGNASSHVTS